MLAVEAVAERERPDRVAVVGVTQRQETRFLLDADVAPVLQSALQRLLDRRGAVGGEQEVGIVQRHYPRQRLAQFDHGPVAVAEHGRVGDLAELVGQSRVELGHAVAECRHPERGDRVEVAAPARVDQLAPLGALHDDRLRQSEAGHLGESMPDACLVAFDPVVHNLQRIGAVR